MFHRWRYSDSDRLEGVKAADGREGFTVILVYRIQNTGCSNQIVACIRCFVA